MFLSKRREAIKSAVRSTDFDPKLKAKYGNKDLTQQAHS